MDKAGILLAEGFEEIEGLTVVDILRRADVEVVTISISDKREVTGAHQITVLADATFSEVDFAQLNGIILPGGMPGTKNLMEHEGVKQIVKEFYAAGKLVAAICAAPSVLGQAGILQGKKAVCYPGFEEQLTGAECLTDKVVRDGTVITSRAMGTAIPFGLALIAYFRGEEKAEEIRASILYGHTGEKQ